MKKIIIISIAILTILQIIVSIDPDLPKHGICLSNNQDQCTKQDPKVCLILQEVFKQYQNQCQCCKQIQIMTKFTYIRSQQDRNQCKPKQSSVQKPNLKPIK